MATKKQVPAEQAVVSSVDALWSLFLSQKKTVRKALAKRIIDLEAAERRNHKKKADEEKVCGKARAKARAIAKSLEDGDAL